MKRDEQTNEWTKAQREQNLKGIVFGSTRFLEHIFFFFRSFVSCDNVR